MCSHFREVHAKSRPVDPVNRRALLFGGGFAVGLLLDPHPINQTKTLRIRPNAASSLQLHPLSRKMGLSESSPNTVQFFILYFHDFRSVSVLFLFPFFSFSLVFWVFFWWLPCRSTSDPLVQPYSIDVLALTRTARWCMDSMPPILNHCDSLAYYHGAHLPLPDLYQDLLLSPLSFPPHCWINGWEAAWSVFYFIFFLILIYPTLPPESILLQIFLFLIQYGTPGYRR